MDMEINASPIKMGFPVPAFKRAEPRYSYGTGLEVAAQWIIKHLDDSCFVTPLTASAQGC